MQEILSRYGSRAAGMVWQVLRGGPGKMWYGLLEYNRGKALKMIDGLVSGEPGGVLAVRLKRRERMRI